MVVYAIVLLHQLAQWILLVDLILIYTQSVYLLTISIVFQYVFSASELPPFFPIPQHLEMAFLPAPPKQLFFCCLEAPTSAGGETCLCDFKKVFDQMDPEIRQQFEEKGVSD